MPETDEGAVKGGAPPERWVVVTALNGYKQSVATALGEALEGGIAINTDGHVVVHPGSLFTMDHEEVASRLRDVADELENGGPIADAGQPPTAEAGSRGE